MVAPECSTPLHSVPFKASQAFTCFPYKQLLIEVANHRYLVMSNDQFTLQIIVDLSAAFDHSFETFYSLSFPETTLEFSFFITGCCFSFSFAVPITFSAHPPNLSTLQTWVLDTLAGASNPQPAGHVWLRLAMNVAQHKLVNLLNILCDFFVITCHNVLNVWPKTTLLLPVQPRDTQSWTPLLSFSCNPNQSHGFMTTICHGVPNVYPVLSPTPD